MLAELNPPQREAVKHGEGPLLVIAGAGSGKTRVLTYRSRTSSPGERPANEILAITFTNKAAGEMRERVSASSSPARPAHVDRSPSASPAAASSPRSGAARFPSSFTIYDQGDQVRLTKQVIESLDLDVKPLRPAAIHFARSRTPENQAGRPDEYVAGCPRLLRPVGRGDVPRSTARA